MFWVVILSDHLVNITKDFQYGKNRLLFTLEISINNFLKHCSLFIVLFSVLKLRILGLFFLLLGGIVFPQQTQIIPYTSSYLFP